MAAQNKVESDSDQMPAAADPNAEQKERLIASVKKEVKQLMEEAVTRKFVHEDSGGVTALCGAVEACLGQGLRRRALGLFKTSSTTALLHKIAKHCPEAALVSARVLAAEGAPATRSASGVERRPSAPRPPLSKRGSGSLLSQSPPQSKYLWIRIALFERQLAKIIEHLVNNATRYYERDALVADPDYGSILSSLLVGPCALEYSKAKAPSCFWTDPPADELVQRHRMSAGTTTPPSVRRPILNFRRSLNASSDDSVSTNTGTGKTGGSTAKDYVESLHQNSTATLLYGKNNVRVQPKDTEEPMPGYLSLHQTAAGLVIKWTPNQLMNGYAESEGIDKSYRCHLVHASACQNTCILCSLAPVCTVYRRVCSGPLCIDCVYWAMSLQVCVWEVVYVHVHRSQASDALILVGQDGVQRPPIQFPKGGHLLSFLSNLETGLLPHGQLDPPLWSQRGTGKVFGRGKIRRRPMPSLCESGETEEAEWEEAAGDYVFRIVNNAITDREAMRRSLLERAVHSPPRTPRRPLASTSTTSSDSSTMSVDCPPSAGFNGHPPQILPPSVQYTEEVPPASIELVCSTMRRQIISRAFYGWLAYCRHLSTVRTHLSGLVHPNIVPREGTESGLTEELWRTMMDNKGVISDKEEVYRQVYYHGVQHEIRREVWPYLLGYYEFGSTAEERAEQDAACRRQYETTMSEWLCVEAIVRQRDREATAASIARLSEASGRPKPVENTEPCEVFEDDYSVISDNPPVVSPEPSENEQKRLDTKPVLSRAPSIDEVDNIELDSEEKEKEIKVNGETETGDNIDVDIDSLKDLDDDEEVHIKSVVENPDLRRESIAEIKRIAEDIVQKGDGRGLLCSVDSANVNINGSDLRSSLDENQPSSQQHTSVIITNPSVDLAPSGSPASGGNTANVSPARSPLGVVREESHSAGASFDMLEPTNDQRPETRSNCVSPASSNGGVYSNELVESFALNLHRIEKDVQRCDRNYPFFTDENLDKLRNIMCTFVWEHLDTGYMQGMCDLAAPLLVMMREEAVAHALFARLMERAKDNFPSGQAMDAHFADMRSLIQILDCELYELMHAHGDYTHFYFCYRWFLLDFKRELLYQDVFSAWELIWAARYVASEHMVLFIALALLETYRDVILANSMDFTDIIKFFNEMAERHDASAVLSLARDLVLQVQTLIENK
ncbi:small G protein signaling modulator 2-like isoform X1 [Galleria mellonella]|uniref:Small G protein signaling modulator 2-like isoform X1 n=1 Tax=Galleria mellonella TaxID=7137 RepID=A0ABM3ML99_GALME|nr:small G protein signaling modulator 2-like isoform X1 [Galleria mellonella]